MGRLALAKMIALPRLLYFLSTIPMVVPKKTFKDLNSRLEDFIWGGAHHRNALTTLFRPMGLGCLAAPDYEAYDMAGQL